MGIVDALSKQTVYLDTNIWIYALEAYPEFVSPLTELFRAIDRGELRAVTSELTLAEVLIKPIFDQNIQRQTVYKQTLRSAAFLAVLPVDREILIQAATLRAESQLKLPDAIHVATAFSTGCSVFLTNDQRLRNIPNLAVHLLSDICLP